MAKRRLNWQAIRNALRLHGMFLHRTSGRRAPLNEQEWWICPSNMPHGVVLNRDAIHIRWSTPLRTEDVVDEILKLERLRHG